MGLPQPVIGLVIRFPYLWVVDQEAGETEGKPRPCAIVSNIKIEGNPIKVMAAPITRAEPKDKRNSVEIPEEAAKRLKLERSWVVCDEANEFDWPHPDMRKIQKSNFNPLLYFPYPRSINYAKH